MDPKSFGNWTYEKMLGSGAFGQVELWIERYTNKRIAIKKCALLNPTEKQIHRWKKEIENMNNLEHPNIVQSELLPNGMSFKSPILCMEFCNKGDLRKVLHKPENSCGLVQKEVLSIMKDVSSAVKYLHSKSITHRDLKPENIVLHEKNGIVMYKLIDLGYAKELGDLTTTASLVGTFNYVAPELFWKQKYTNSVDYWSLGILFFEVLTGYKPFIPHLENISKWINNMQNKKYEEICATEINGGITFYDHIIYPNDLSKNILNNIVEWFQVALQWDPRQRGKIPGSDDIVVFPLLREIFPWQTIYIVLVSFYGMDQFNINNTTSLLELQLWIEKKSSIPINEQVIADTSGNVLSKIKSSDKFLLKNINDPILYVYKSGCLEFIDFYNNTLPKIIDCMLVEPNTIKNRSQLRQCYTALIYVMRHEIMLFQQYILALGTKLDMIKQQLNILQTNIQKSLPDSNLLLREVTEISHSINPQITAANVVEMLNDLFHKIKNLCDTINGLKNEAGNIENFIHQIKQFFDSEKLFYGMEKYTKCFEDFLSMFCSFEKERNCYSDYIIDQVNTLSDVFCQFEEQKESLLKDPEMIKFIRQLTHLEKNLLSHFEIMTSAMELIPFYKNKLTELIVRVNMPNQQSGDIGLDLLINDDREIRDNIVLRAISATYIQELLQEWSKMVL